MTERICHREGCDRVIIGRAEQARYCSITCRRRDQRERLATPEFREKERLRMATPEYREKERLRTTTPEYREKRRLYEATPEYREKRHLREATPEYREKLRQRPNYHKQKLMASSKRRARKAGVPTDNSTNADIATAHGYGCAICGNPFILSDAIERDHFNIPIRYLGSNLLFNLRLAHKSCNSSKNDRLPESITRQLEGLMIGGQLIDADDVIPELLLPNLLPEHEARLLAHNYETRDQLAAEFS
jgi:5-methylcytosine-specific restriction endonuclease McrA